MSHSVRPRHLVRVFLVSVVGVAASFALAGPLDPPAGPVVSTGKTLAEVEPRIAVSPTTTPGSSIAVFVISAPGSYYLTGNVAGASGKSGVLITSGGVTLDLNGFELAGVPGSGSGVLASGAVTGVTVKNGTVRGWGVAGVSLLSAAGSILRDLISVGNSGVGISAGASASITGCVARQNAVGIQCADKGVVTGCTAALNTGNGFSVGTASAVMTCTADDNGGDGINGGFLCNITSCTVSRNTGDGIDLNSSCVVANCSASENGGNGIAFDFFCVVSGNTCAFSGGSGIRADGDRNRIEHNNCASGGIGIEVIGTRNLVIGNNCGGNTTNYRIVTGNRYGPIIDATATTGAAATGNSAPSTLLSTDANANFAH